MNRYLLISVNKRRFAIHMKHVTGIESYVKINQSDASDSDLALYDLSFVLFNTEIGNSDTVLSKVVRIKSGDATVWFHVDTIDGSPQIPEDRIDSLPLVFGDTVSCFPQVLKINKEPVPVLNPGYIINHHSCEKDKLQLVEEKSKNSANEITPEMSKVAEDDDLPSLAEETSRNPINSSSYLETRLAETINFDTVTRVLERIVSEKVVAYLTGFNQQASSSETSGRTEKNERHTINE